jgi:hypothetical protein
VNTVVWTERYDLYAAQVPNFARERILPIARCLAVECGRCPFLGTHFGSPQAADDVPRGRFGIRNDAPFAGGFGLSQAAWVNSSRRYSPLNLVVLPPGFGADFASEADLHIWAGAEVDSGVTASTVPEEALRMPLRPRNAEAFCLAGPLTISVSLSFKSEETPNGNVVS